MGTITSIREGKRRGRIDLFLDGRLTFSLQEEVVSREGLRVGQDLSNGQLEALTRADQCIRCYRAAAGYLSYRPRSESELRERLGKRGFDAASIDDTLTRLKSQRLLNDGEFARFWRDNRQSFRPRSRWLTGMELKRKGVSPEAIEAVVSEIDDAESAYRAAQSKMRLLSGLDYATLRRKLGDYLKRRGFSYEVIDQTVKRVWGEAKSGGTHCLPADRMVVPREQSENGVK